MIAVKLLIWKNIMDKERTLKTLQDSVAWIRKPFHQSAASATRITTWQATWSPNNIQHFLVNLYFFPSLKQLSNNSPLKKIAAKSSTNIKRGVGTAKYMMRERNPSLVRGWMSCIDVCLESAQLSYQYRGEPREVWTRTEKHRNGYPSMILILRFRFVRNKRKKVKKIAKSTAFYEKCEVPLSEE